MEPSPDTKPQSRGFSLVEVMVGMAVLIILVAIFGQMMSQTSRVWGQTESKKSRMQNARAIADMIGSELRAALAPINRLDLDSLQFVVNPDLPTDYLNRDAIFWQAPAANMNANGDIAEVGYFVKWDAQVAQNPRAHLCRFFVDASTTVPASVGDPAPGHYFKIYSEPTAWVTQSIVDILAPGGGAGYRGLFAENVLGMWVQCVDSTGAAIRRDCRGEAFENEGFDSRRGFEYRDRSGVTRTTPSYLDAAGKLVRESALPPAVDISFILLDPETAGRITPSTQGLIQNTVHSVADASLFVEDIMSNEQLKFLRQGVRSFRARVHLQNSK